MNSNAMVLAEKHGIITDKETITDKKNSRYHEQLLDWCNKKLTAKKNSYSYLTTTESYDSHIPTS